MNLGHSIAGAGGNWPRQGETKDPRVVVQEKPVYCGCACVSIVLAETDIEVPSQDQLYGMAGGIPFSCSSLAETLNELDHVRAWNGAYIGTTSGEDYRGVFRILSQHQWIAELWEPFRVIGHLVVVDDYAGGELIILDPAHPGTSYRMTYGDFTNHWTFGAVYLI